MLLKGIQKFKIIKQVFTCAWEYSAFSNVENKQQEACEYKSKYIYDQN